MNRSSVPLFLFLTLLFIAQSAGQTAPQSNSPNTQELSTAQGDANAYLPNQVTKKAVVTFKPVPGLTEAARKNDTEGIIRVKVLLQADGQVTNITPLNELPDGLTEMAIAAAQQIKFVPAEKDGHPVSQWLTLEYAFHVILDENARVQKKIVILDQPQPEYTDEARLHKTQGTVVLKVAFFSDGRIQVFRVYEKLPDGLTEAAIKAAKKIKFTPAQINEHPVSQIKTITYTFSLP